MTTPVMAASRHVKSPAVDIEREIECCVCKEDKPVCTLTCGHICCQECIGR